MRKDENVYRVYVAMFIALDEAYREGFESDELLYFLGDANPFNWSDGRSTDPIVYNDFEKDFQTKFVDENISYDESRLFVREWLSKEMRREEVYRGNIVQAFDSAVTPSEWIEILHFADRIIRDRMGSSN